jgi:hypothetical protein
MAVPNRADRNRPEIAAATTRASGAVVEVGFDPADDAIIAACSTADTSADVCTAQRPASRAAIKQTRKSGSTTANSTSACPRFRLPGARRRRTTPSNPPPIARLS